MSPSSTLPAFEVPRTQNPVAPGPTGIFLPKEHGSWSLAFEPLALGLIAAPSLAGAAFAAAVLAGFFARRPLRIAAGSGPAARRQAAREAVVMFSAMAAAGFVEAAILGGATALWPVLAMAPLAVLFLHFDSRNESRAAAAEVVGSAALALTPAALASLAGWSLWPVMALSVAMLARSVPTVMAVRFCLRLAKGQTSGLAATLLPLLSAFAGCLALAALHSFRLAPAAAPILSLVLVLRAGFYVIPRRPFWPARRVGIFEASLGAAYVAILALAWSPG